MTVHHIALTGGPCGGKSTSLSRVADRLEALGYRVFLVPEVATILLTGGVSLAGIDPAGLLRFEGHLLKLQLDLEDRFLALAREVDAPAVVISDRGAMDVAAYLDGASWQALLDEHGWSEVALRERRYDAVIHLVTAAHGAEAHYTTANNPARSESLEEARALDERLQAAWLGHPHQRIIDNRGDFPTKIRRVIVAICGVLGEPEPREIERKFLLGSVDPADLPPHKSFDIEQTYLLSAEGEARVRRRTYRGASVYTHTVKRPIQTGERVEIERRVAGAEYITLLGQADPERRTVRKTRRVFHWERQVFELDTFTAPRRGLTLLEIELDALDQPVSLPPFLDLQREVTGEPAWGNHAIAKPHLTAAAIAEMEAAISDQVYGIDVSLSWDEATGALRASIYDETFWSYVYEPDDWEDPDPTRWVEVIAEDRTEIEARYTRRRRELFRDRDLPAIEQALPAGCSCEVVEVSPQPRYHTDIEQEYTPHPPELALQIADARGVRAEVSVYRWEPGGVPTAEAVEELLEALAERAVEE